MVRRLADQYRPGDLVEIVFEAAGDDRWYRGVVRRSEPPGLWVQTEDGASWFVTNTGRIRPVPLEEDTGSERSA